jgi:HK97 family phage portal protein
VFSLQFLLASKGNLADERFWTTLSGWTGYGGKAKSGSTVTEQTAYTVPAYFDAIRIIAEDVAKLPFVVFERENPRGRRRAPSHPAYNLLHTRSNPNGAAINVRAAITGHALGYGNGYAEIQRNGSGKAIALWPVHPSRVSVKYDERDNLYYDVSGDAGAFYAVRPENMLHVPGFGGDGITGHSVLRCAVESLGVSISSQEFASAFLGNGARPSGLIQRDPGPAMTAEQTETLRRQFAEYHSGSAAAGKPAILPAGAKWVQLTVPPDEAQFLETRKFQIEEIARWFRLPPHKLASMDKATFSNIEHQAIEYVVDCLTPWLVRWEQECNAKLLSESEQERYYCEHVTEGLLRGDFVARTQGYTALRNLGVLTANDIAERENLPMISEEDGGDERIVQGAMISMRRLMASRDDPQTVREPRPTSGNAESAKFLTEKAIARVLNKEAKAIARMAEKDDFSKLDGLRADLARDASHAVAEIAYAFKLKSSALNEAAAALFRNAYPDTGADAIARDMETRAETVPNEIAELMAAMLSRKEMSHAA